MNEEKNVDDLSKPNGWELDRPDKMNKSVVERSLNSALDAYNREEESAYEIPGFYIHLGDSIKQFCIVIDLESNTYLPLLHKNRSYVDSAVDFLRKHREC